MPTLQELVEQDLGLGAPTNEKTASDKTPVQEGGDASLTAMAENLGLLGDQGQQKTASDNTEGDNAGDQNTASNDAGDGDINSEQVKTASAESMDLLYNQMFPEDGGSGIPKTAEQEKIAEEEDLGARTYDHFAARFDERMEKMAADVLTGNATISSGTAGSGAGETDNPHSDSQPPQASDNNKPADASSKIDTTPTITDEVKAKNEAKTVGNFQQKSAAMNIAFRKAFLQDQLAGDK